MKMYNNKRFETVLKILFVPIILWSSSFSFVSTARATTITDAGEVVKGSVIKMISHVFVMDTYAQMIVELPSLQLKNVQSIDAPLSQRILQDYEKTRTDAKLWLGDIQPNIVAMNEQILQYNTLFQKYYNNLMVYVNRKDKSTFIKEVDNLYQNSLAQKNKVDNVLDKLKQFRDIISGDSQRLKGDSVQFIAMATSLNENIPFLKQQIETQQIIIKQYQDQMKTGELLQKVLMGCIGEPFITNAEDKIKSAEQTIHDLKIKMYGLQWEVSQMIDATAKMIYMTETIDTAIDAVQNMSNYWKTTSAKYHVLLKNVANTTNVDFSFIKDDLHVTKESWESIQELAKQLQNTHLLH
ncbi:HBL/NHE enterotoxin family protein [Bacillus cereus]|uniref:HBL/NHE enterotoxin family protein n=1 Tax=Bacillus cereus TaxID=1396 RepID=UPI00397EF516